jgi:hypothetical protein
MIRGCGYCEDSVSRKFNGVSSQYLTLPTVPLFEVEADVTLVDPRVLDFANRDGVAGGGAVRSTARGDVDRGAGISD